MDKEEQARRPKQELDRVAVNPPSFQRGWVGLVVLLLALVIVALLAQSALKQYGMVPGTTPAANSGDLQRGPGVSPAPLDPSAGTPAPTTPIERARGVERTLQRDAQDLSRRIDEQTK